MSCISLKKNTCEIRFLKKEYFFLLKRLDYIIFESSVLLNVIKIDMKCFKFVDNSILF